MTYEIDFAVPCASGDDCDGADGPIDGIGGGDMSTVGRPGATAEVSGQRRGRKGGGDGLLEREVVALVVSAGIGLWGSEVIYSHGAVVAGGGKVFVGRVEGDAFDMTLVLGESLELLERVAGPNDDL